MKSNEPELSTANFELYQARNCIKPRTVLSPEQTMPGIRLRYPSCIKPGTAASSTAKFMLHDMEYQKYAGDYDHVDNDHYNSDDQGGTTTTTKTIIMTTTVPLLLRLPLVMMIINVMIMSMMVMTTAMMTK
ncbi:hypothetical protein DPMN_130323 [Dreissena polymorpha]|uniref:Uncharacterized protein n=1 Tax=Dreissena polymorpha TaxID=45954 RepID=A0A9D4JXH2_DREPO|nr:hypothetical protein DPMN_130323 [Dreissena polymorpha]